MSTIEGGDRAEYVARILGASLVPNQLAATEAVGTSVVTDAIKAVLRQQIRWVVVGVLAVIALASTQVIAAAMLADALTDRSGNLVLGFVLVAIAMLATPVVLRLATSRIVLGVAERLRMDLLDRALSARLRTLERIGSNRLQWALVQDAERILQGCEAIIVLAGQLGMIVTVLIIVASTSLTLAAWTAIALAAVAVGAWLLQTVVLRHVVRMYLHFAAVADRLTGLDAGFKQFKLNAKRRRAFVDAVTEDLRAFVPHDATIEAYASIRTPLAGLLILGAIVLASTLGVSHGLVAARDLPRFAFPISLLATLVDPYLFSVEMAGKLREIVAEWGRLGIGFVASEEPIRKVEATSSIEAVELRDVTFRYPGNTPLETFEIGPVSVSVKRGRILFLVGGNGSGKSTLARILCGLYPPDAGEVVVNDTPVTDDNRQWYRAHFGAVFAQVMLPSTPEMIAPTVSAERATSLVERLGLTGIVKLENRAMTATGTLSVGQQKRVALLATLLEDRPVLLFDEWTAEQDHESRERFYTELLPELRAAGKAVVVVSHDDAYFGVADDTLKLERGRVA